MSSVKNVIHIRPIDPDSDAEIDCVARRMRATLVEVEGEAAGTALYTLDWLRDRVRWHLDPDLVTAAVLLAEDACAHIVGHTIVRSEHAEAGEPFGLVSTTYVEPAARRLGVGESLLLAGERWFACQGLRHCATWTSATNAKLIALYATHGYSQTATHTHETTGSPMVRLSKNVDSQGVD